MALNVNKTIGKNKISVKIIKISDEVMTKPSSIICRDCQIVANVQP